MLYVVSGRGVGVVGRVEREVDAGSLLYVPQGAWHGIRATEEIEVCLCARDDFGNWLETGGRAGAGDQLVPLSAAQSLVDELPEATLTIVPGRSGMDVWRNNSPDKITEADYGAIIKGLQGEATFKKEEQRRFEILLAHWDVNVERTETLVAR